MYKLKESHFKAKKIFFNVNLNTNEDILGILIKKSNLFAWNMIKLKSVLEIYN